MTDWSKATDLEIAEYIATQVMGWHRGTSEPKPDPAWEGWLDRGATRRYWTWESRLACGQCAGCVEPGFNPCVVPAQANELLLSHLEHHELRVWRCAVSVDRVLNEWPNAGYRACMVAEVDRRNHEHPVERAICEAVCVAHEQNGKG